MIVDLFPVQILCFRFSKHKHYFFLDDTDPAIDIFQQLSTLNLSINDIRDGELPAVLKLLEEFICTVYRQNDSMIAV